MFERGRFGWGRGGWGRGNPYPFCRWYPWRPRWWWAYGAGSYRAGAGYVGTYPAGARPPYYRPARRYPW
jgi:hypothetical protein